MKKSVARNYCCMQC